MLDSTFSSHLSTPAPPQRLAHSERAEKHLELERINECAHTEVALGSTEIRRRRAQGGEAGVEEVGRLGRKWISDCGSVEAPGGSHTGSAVCRVFKSWKESTRVSSRRRVSPTKVRLVHWR